MSEKESKINNLKVAPDPKVRAGLTTAEAEKLYETVGFNELPYIEVSLVWLFFVQFTGVMPYMLEIAFILALAVQSYADFAIIFSIVLCNGCLGFHEELKAKAALDALTEKMEQKIAVLRDGQAQNLLTRLLVPGDVILLVGGCSVPADVEWLEGDVLSLDTAALTGEPLPRKYPSDEYGSLILCGCTVVAGEAYCVVRQTGVNTEIGSSNAAIMEDKAVKKVSVFEDRILLVVKIIIFASVVDVIIIFLVQGIARGQFTPGQVRTLIASCLSIIIASVPVALPLVLQVTMALGAGMMARDHNAVVTSLPALQDIASMTVLCSDKTGTLTTAKISIISDAVWCAEGHSKHDVAFYAGLASNRDKKEDPIDRAVIQHFDRTLPDNRKAEAKECKLVRSVGFNPIYKRVLWQYNHPKLGNITIAKGLANKVIDTAEGGADDAEDQWKCEHHETLLPIVSKVDSELSKTGYKTLGVSVRIGDGPFQFIGILPMLDPPRHDTATTIKNLINAQVRVKMITGDHLNIAKETARMIGMGVNIHKGEEVRTASETRDEMIWDSDGFAQVLPRDKREVVLVLRNKFQRVVGMTGDGVNDAPALSAAQCGVAVDDATDAAKNAAAIILTTPGLSAIYSAIIESRRIFRKLKSYVIYRFAATVQIVIVLTLLIYISNCPIDSLFIVLFALLNDLTLLPIAYDEQCVSATPEYPKVTPILVTSLTLGLIQTGFSMLWAYASYKTHIFKSDFDIFKCTRAAQGGVWVQVFIQAEILIFAARAPTWTVLSIAPAPSLFISVMLGCLLVTILACATTYFGSLWVQDAVIIWCYDIICFFVIDGVKVFLLHLLGEDFEPLKVETAETVKVLEKRVSSGHIELSQHEGDIETGPNQVTTIDDDGKDEIVVTRAASNLKKLGEWGQSPAAASVASASRSASNSSISLHRQGSASTFATIAAKRNSSSSINSNLHAPQTQPDATANVGSNIDVFRRITEGRITITGNAGGGSMTNLRGKGNLSSASLRPYTPANKAVKR